MVAQGRCAGCACTDERWSWKRLPEPAAPCDPAVLPAGLSRQCGAVAALSRVGSRLLPMEGVRWPVALMDGGSWAEARGRRLVCGRARRLVLRERPCGARVGARAARQVDSGVRAAASGAAPRVVTRLGRGSGREACERPFQPLCAVWAALATLDAEQAEYGQNVISNTLY